MAGAPRVEHLVTSGTFELDGGSWEVDNNVWLVGDDDEVVVIDAAHDARAILAAVGGRRLSAVVCTHGDTLFAGGPGVTGRSYSDFGTIIASIGDRLLTLPGETVVHTGHGDTTSIAAESPHFEEWAARGW